MTVQQFNGTYVPSEDRILFRLNTDQSEEFRLWLTQRIVRQLLEALGDDAIKQITDKSPTTRSNAKKIDAFSQEAMSQQINFASTYKPANRLPIGAEPILVSGFNLTNKSDGICHLSLNLANKLQLGLPLTQDMLGKFRLMLNRLIEKAGWQMVREANTNDPVPPMVIPHAPGSLQ